MPDEILNEIQLANFNEFCIENDKAKKAGCVPHYVVDLRIDDSNMAWGAFVTDPQHSTLYHEGQELTDKWVSDNFNGYNVGGWKYSLMHAMRRIYIGDMYIMNPLALKPFFVVTDANFTKEMHRNLTKEDKAEKNAEYERYAAFMKAYDDSFGNWDE